MNFNLPTSATAVTPDKPVGTRRQLLTPIPDLPDEYLLVIDNSSLEKFTTCPKSAYNYLVLGREAHAKNAALVFGGAIHAGLEQLLRGESVEVAQKHVRDFFLLHPAPPDEYRTAANACEIIQHYSVRATFPDYEWTVLRDSNNDLFVERAFELPLGIIPIDADMHLADKKFFVKNVHVAWSGRMDLAAHCNNANRVVDHKTTSIAGDQVVQDFHLSNQTLGYVWAARQLEPNLNITGFCVNFIHFKKPTKNAGLMDRGPRGGDPSLAFFRAYFDYAESRISAWHDNALTIVSDFLHCLVRNQFPMHTKWCFGKYGACPYHLPCIQDDPRVEANLLQSDMFKTVTWNPVR